MRTSRRSRAVIIFSGHLRLKAEAEAAGWDAFVLKPTLEELLVQLATLVAARVRESAQPIAARQADRRSRTAGHVAAAL